MTYFYLESPMRWVWCPEIHRRFGGVVETTYYGETIRGLRERRVGQSVLLER